ncbi:hypothetical protein ACEWY4_017983 [Coilia grayii]|uniref:AIG1-type G domain-containing protein n=1 Tax=Coilia grayii TaxID=363190 RepID=A0ABD1JIK5_9TELE
MQVTQLMEKIEEMVSGNRGQHYEMDRLRREQLEEKRRRDDERVKERIMKVKMEKELLRSQMGDSLHLVELRIVLLGYRHAGRSSSGNTILGREEFDTAGRTAQCVKRQGEVAGRHITVVEAPGWWRDDSTYKTSNLTKEEIELSVSLCPPGPHALLLVIRVDVSFTDTHRRAVQEHLELFSKRVWSHTIVLFTCGDWLGDTPIEQHIESEGESLQWLVEKCENRYHVLNNKKRDNHMQVTQLMEKIEEMVAGNRGQHYEMERWRKEELEYKRRRDDERMKERSMKVKMERELLRSQMGDSLHLAELRIVLLGYRHAGRSSSGNTILGREEFDTARRTAQCMKKQGEVAGRHITVVEAPGWWRHDTTDKTSNLTKEEIKLSVSLCPPGPHALLLVIRVDKSFTHTYRRAVQEHLELLGEAVWSHTIVLFTRGDRLGVTPIEQHIESEGESLQWLVEKCGNRYHVLNNEKRDDHMQVTQLMEKIDEMVAGNRGQHYGNQEQQPLPVRKARSYDLIPPSMSGDYDQWSLASSAYSSLRSTASYDISSLRGSVRSTTSSQSSGIGSLGSRAGSGRSFDSRVKKALPDVPEGQERPESEGHVKDEKKKSTKESSNIL